MSIRTRNMQSAIKGFDPFQNRPNIPLSEVRNTLRARLYPVD
jgi:hypothetical protein